MRLKKSAAVAVLAAWVAGPVAAQDAGTALFNALVKLSNPCDVMAYQTHLNAQNEILRAQVEGGAPSGDMGASGYADAGKCYDDARQKSRSVYRNQVELQKSDKLKADARNVYAAWLGALGKHFDMTEPEPLESIHLDEAVSAMDADSAL